MKKMYAAVCTVCGEGFDVPFKPKHDTDLLCKDCYKAEMGYY